jgi:hypothetical protein
MQSLVLNPCADAVACPSIRRKSIVRAMLLSGIFGTTPKNTKPSAVGSLRAMRRAPARMLSAQSDKGTENALLGFHPVGRDRPHGGFEIELTPSRHCARRAPGPRHAGGMDESFDCRRSARQGEAMKFAFPEDGAIVERIEDGLKEEGPFDA